MMQNTTLEELEREYSEEEENEGRENVAHKSDNAWPWKKVSSEESKKWEFEKERYDEIIEYIKEVDEILNLIRPFPRDDCERLAENQQPDSGHSSSQSRYKLDHLGNIIKLVEQLKQLQENNSKVGEKTYCLKDLKKLREHKKRLKNEEFEWDNRSKTQAEVSPDGNHEEFFNWLSKTRKISSTASEKLENETEGWQHKRKSLCLPPLDGQKSKVSKWIKVKEAFHWEKTSVAPKNDKKEFYCSQSPEEKHAHEMEGKQFVIAPVDFLSDHVLLPPYPPPFPPPPPLLPPPPIPPKTFTKSKDLLSVCPVPDLPSSSSSDRLEDFFSESLIKGGKYQDAESSSHFNGVEDNDEFDKGVGKYSSEEFPQNLCKEDLMSQSSKSNKTTWGKVKDIIQTRKDSLKKKSKKRGSDEFKKRRKLSSSQCSDQFEDLSSPEEKTKNLESLPKTGFEFPEDPSSPKIEEKCGKKLMPALTVTLPSTEELRNLSGDDCPERRETLEEEKSSHLENFSCQAQYCEDKTKTEKYKSEQNQRLSRWIKVKRVFLTSGTLVRAPHCSSVNDSSPTSQNKSSFFSDMESDEPSSGEWIDYKSPSQEKPKAGELESQMIKEDIKKSYNALQKKLSREFDQKLREWEIKSEGSILQDDSSPKLKLNEGDTIPKFRKIRDSMAVPLPNLNDLSPEFKKKLNDWKKIKTCQSSCSVSTVTKEEIPGQNIKIRIGEWQPWRNRSSQKVSSEDFSKKGDEGQSWRIGDGRSPPNCRKDGSETSARRDSKRRDSVKKISRNRMSSGSESLISNSSGEKDGKLTRRTTQKMKDFQWVEKELQKIEREKLRLEQEKEKYLEREARLEKMKKTIRTALPAEEIMVRTPAGFFRFKGISQKFTKKLYEWEKARGIAPEASTFALLEESARRSNCGDCECEGDQLLQRSKSTGSVPEISSSLLLQSMVHHPSSLSLNDFEELKNRDEHDLDETPSFERVKADSEEPEAVIVEVEDVVEETALLADTPFFKKEIPVYTYASDESNHVVCSDERTCFSETSKILSESKTSNKSDESEFAFRKISKTCDTTETTESSQFEKNDFSENKITFLVKDSKTFEIKESKAKEPVENSESFSALSHQRSEAHHQFSEEIKFPAVKTGSATEVVVPALTKSPKTFFDWKSNTEVENLVGLRLPQHEDFFQNRTAPKALEKKIKEKISLMQRMSMEGSSSHSWRCSGYNYVKPKNQERDSEGEQTKKQEELIKRETLDSFFVPHESTTNSEEQKINSDSFKLVNVFVPTTRKIISPVKTTQGSTPSVCSYTIDDVKPNENSAKEKKSVDEVSNKSTDGLKTFQSISADADTINPSGLSTIPSPVLSLCFNQGKKKPESDTEVDKKHDIGMPPLPHSPKFPKKLNPKETAPSIRMIIAKYNQKISEHENTRTKASDPSSPTIWRSPVFGRRTLEKTERSKQSGEVKKSASLDNMSATQVSNSVPQPLCRKGILKSSSFDVVKVNQNSDGSKNVSVVDANPSQSTSVAKMCQSSAESLMKENSPAALRALRIQKAKEEFLCGSSCKASTIPISAENQAEEKSAATEPSLIKSVSSETIGSDKNPLQSKEKLQKSSSKFDISSIKSKFRKIRMRKEKDPKMNAVAVLCRQSLLIEISKSSDKSECGDSLSKSCPSSPVMDRNKGKTHRPEESKPK